MATPTREPLELNEEERIYELIREGCEDDIRRMAKALAGKDDSNLLGQTEFELRDRVHALGAKALETVANERQKKGGYEKASCVCPYCKGDARCVSIRTRRVDSLLGSFHIRRHYYHCRKCRTGLFPRDQAHLDSASERLRPAASQVVSIAGLQTSFAQSSEVTLQKLCGLQFSKSTVERACKSVVRARLKQSGVRCSKAGSKALCQFRKLYLSQPACWEDYCKNHAD